MSATHSNPTSRCFYRCKDLLLSQAYLVGLTFALAASPCSTPILATLLAYVASSQDPLLGGGLLLAYTTGYITTSHLYLLIVDSRESQIVTDHRTVVRLSWCSFQVRGASAACCNCRWNPQAASVTTTVQRLDHTSFWSALAIWRNIHPAVASAVKSTDALPCSFRSVSHPSRGLSAVYDVI